MMIHEVTAQVGKHKQRKRIGRGPGSGHGKTAGRGHKGAGSRAGHSTRFGHEGGQMPLVKRWPKRGFSNAAFRNHFRIVNLRSLDSRFEDGAEVNTDMLIKVGLIRDAKLPVKILGSGDLSKKLTVTAAAFSKSAEEKIKAAGGTATVV